MSYNYQEFNGTDSQQFEHYENLARQENAQETELHQIEQKASGKSKKESKDKKSKKKKDKKKKGSKSKSGKSKSKPFSTFVSSFKVVDSSHNGKSSNSKNSKVPVLKLNNVKDVNLVDFIE